MDAEFSQRIKTLTVAELLAIHAGIGDELRARSVVRSANNPVGDLAEYLFCKAFGWEQAINSVRGYDAIDGDGIRYQIKGRRINGHNKSRQLSAIRDIASQHFDILAGVLFDTNFSVTRAALIPATLVTDRARFSRHTNSSIFHLRDDVWDAEGVRDVTQEITNAMP